jgi:hypothetical protein
MAPGPAAAAPGPAAAAPGPAANRNGLATANDDWASKLPPVAAVKQAITGSNAADTAARQEAAFATLCDYIEARNGGMFKVMAPSMKATWQAFNHEQSRSHPSMPRSVSPAAEHYFNQREFREATLTKLISVPAFRAYAQTASYQALPSVDQRAAQDEEVSLARQIQADVKKAKKEHATLLGVPLGVSLNYPICPEGVEPPSPMRAIGLEQLAQALGGQHTAKPQGAACWYGRTAGNPGQLVFLQLPVWVVMPLEMNTTGLYLDGATLIVRETDDLYKQLLRKYGPPTRRTKHSFQNGYGATAERDGAEWLLPGVYVKYTPQAGDIQNPVGNLQVQLESVHQASLKRQEAEEEKGPQL